MPRPKVKIDLVEIEKLAGMQATDEEFAAFFNVSVRTIERRRKNPKFREAIERGQAKGKLSLRRYLFRQAAGGNVAAAIFLSKNYLGLKDVVSNEHSGPGGQPIEHTVSATELILSRIASIAARSGGPRSAPGPA